MSEPKDKIVKTRAPRAGRAEAEKFDPYWNNKAGTVDNVAEYIQNATREPKGFHRGARIR